ncbi:hypothetical protein ASC95_27035 [Pelomonas sp. Root1217]|uniref:hypothetical protein n=1 Tax=Pelomonas sp. Root1217 TaxID=1736430 RepID=UPI00070D749B|nr:hypothetical protein [Pelomonas sp. Root1217]KQV46259.1 hypothetical protein ASC95_27035 [Pelomonas sp. Root1217]
MRAAFIALLFAAPLAQAADEPTRDPTAWPPALRSAMAASAAPAASGIEPADNAIRQVVFAGGRAYVVQRGRRYGVGEQIEGARIERITEQAVWLREAGQVRREPLYGGVEKRPPPQAAMAASGVKKSKEKP